MEKIKTANIEKVVNALKKQGITNPYAISGILAIISKESGFIPQSEKPYNNTANSRIREIFSEARNLTDAQLTEIKKDPVKFFNLVYGGEYGNAANEGYKYRGRGFNQLTFKNNYKVYSDLLKKDLVNNPDLVNDPDIAAQIVALYMKRKFDKDKDIILKRYGVKNINDFNNINTAVNAFYNANAGFGKDTSQIMPDGKKIALQRAPGLFEIVTNYIEDNPGAGGLIVLAGGLILYNIFK